MMHDPAMTKRRFERVAIRSLSRVFPEGSGDGLEAFVEDIGRGGLGLYVMRPLAVDRSVTVKLEFTDPRGLNRVESISGRVVWANPSENQYRVGIQFSEAVSPMRNAGLFAYLESVGLG